MKLSLLKLNILTTISNKNCSILWYSFWKYYFIHITCMFSILSLLIYQIRHNHRLAHIINLVYKNFKLLDEIVMHIKHLLLKVILCKRRWVSFLNSQNSNLPSTLPLFRLKHDGIRGLISYSGWTNIFLKLKQFFFLMKSFLMMKARQFKS